PGRAAGAPLTAVGGGMTTVRPPKQRRSRESYERVLDAARALLEENGFEGLTVQEVAIRSGVSIGAIYERFGNKETLLRAVHARLMEAMLDADELGESSFLIHHAVDPERDHGVPSYLLGVYGVVD